MWSISPDLANFPGPLGATYSAVVAHPAAARDSGASVTELLEPPRNLVRGRFTRGKRKCGLLALLLETVCSEEEDTCP